jgi:FHA domain
MANLTQFCEQQRDLIANEQFEMVINNLRKLLSPLKHSIYNDVLTFSFNLKSHRTQYLTGEINNTQYNLFLTQTFNGLLSLLSEIEHNATIKKGFERQRTADAPETNSVTVILESNDARVQSPKIMIYDDIVIGRGNTCGIIFEDQLISWEHARIIIEGNIVLLEDLNSRNGTFVDGVKLTGTKKIVRLHFIQFHSI